MKDILACVIVFLISTIAGSTEETRATTVYCNTFPEYCPTECTAIDSQGCLICTCAVQSLNSSTTSSLPANNTSASGQNSSSTSGGSITSSGGSMESSSGSLTSSGGIMASSGGSMTSSGGSVTSGTSDNNLAGCPKLADNCNFDCLVIGTHGCIECTCTTSGKTSPSFSGGSTLTGSGSISQPASGSQVHGGSPFLTGSTYNASAQGSLGTSAQASQNVNGCPPFPSNCDIACAYLNTNGCPICSCSRVGDSSKPSNAPESVSSTSSGSSVTSAGSSMTSSNHGANLNGCPPFTPGCTADCVGLDFNGCPVCVCHQTGSGPKTGTGSSVPNTSHQMSSGAASNANGCPQFLSTCKQECVTLDGHGCPICLCQTGSTGHNNTSLSSLTSSLTSPHASSNLNGCPAFPNNCRAECLDLSSDGCPICTCRSTGGSSSNTPYHGQSVGLFNNNNGCPLFRANCPAECTSTNDQGCPVCTCSGTSAYLHVNPVSSSSKTSTPSSVLAGSTTPSPNTNSNGQECPTLIANCNTACLWSDEHGCVLCNGDCNDNLSNKGGSSVSSTTPANITPTLTSSTSTTKPSGGGHGVDCQAFDAHNCPANCATFDSRGCLTCTCAVAPHGGSNNHTGGDNANGCSPFDASCPSGCAAIDSNGCLYCTCSVPSSAASVATSTSRPNSSVSGSVQCPAFDGTTCNPTCIGIDKNGCLTCDCGPSGTTAAPSLASMRMTTSLPGGGRITTYASGVVGPEKTGSGSGGGTENGNGCAPFDASCQASCAQLDVYGCLVCRCDPTTSTPSAGSTPVALTTESSSISPTSGYVCPYFDTNCKASCAAMNGMGCLICTCSLGSGSGLNGGTGNNAGCQAFDTSCLASCTSLNEHGCPVCTCTPSTTQLPSPKTMRVSTTSLPVTSAVTTTPTHSPVTIACPKFDATCPRSCTYINASGCLECTCIASKTTQVPTTQTTVSTTTPTPPTTHAPVMTTKVPVQPITTTVHQTPPITTTPVQTQPTVTTQAPKICPPIRCIYPCDAGVTLGSDNCPICQCRAVTTTVAAPKS